MNASRERSVVRPSSTSNLVSQKVDAPATKAQAPVVIPCDDGADEPAIALKAHDDSPILKYNMCVSAKGRVSR